MQNKSKSKFWSAKFFDSRRFLKQHFATGGRLLHILAYQMKIDRLGFGQKWFKIIVMTVGHPCKHQI